MVILYVSDSSHRPGVASMFDLAVRRIGFETGRPGPTSETTAPEYRMSVRSLRSAVQYCQSAEGDQIG